MKDKWVSSTLSGGVESANIDMSRVGGTSPEEFGARSLSWAVVLCQC